MVATIRTLPNEFPEIFVNRIIISGIAFAVFCAVSIFLYKKHKFNKLQCGVAILLSLYIVVLLYFTVVGRYSQVLRQLLINFVMLMPVGFLLPVVIKAKHKYLITMALSLLLTVFIETMQLITKCGSFEVDDIINNFIGAVLGMLIYMLFNRIIQKRKGNHYERM